MPPFIAVLAGAVAALLLRSTLKFVANLIIARRPLAEYDCGDDGTDEDPAALRHGWGKQVTDSGAEDGVAWEFSEDRPRARDREHTIYGPYSNDFGRPGYFRVSFRIAGFGVEPRDRVVIVVDVMHAPFDLQRNHVVLGQKTIRAQDLRPKYRSFDVVFHTSGSGVFEYRVSVIRRAVDPSREHIRFDTIKVYPHFPLWEVI